MAAIPTAAEAYSGAYDAKRRYVLECITNSVRNGHLSVKVWYEHMYAGLVKELKDAGYSVIGDGSQYTVSWQHPSATLQ